MSKNRGMNLLRVVARPLLAAPFIADGVDALMHPRFHVERAAGVRPLIDKATDAVGLEPLTDQRVVRVLRGESINSYASARQRMGQHLHNDAR